jgi:hypothetical protein
MHRLSRVLVTALLASGIGVTSPATAGDLCLQLSGASCDLSGDLGFFRFMGAKLPKNPKKAAALHGRACGTGTAWGTAVRNAENTVIELAATFVCDATPGMLGASLSIADTGIGTVHPGDASYNAFALGSSCDVTIVDCDAEPGLAP